MTGLECLREEMAKRGMSKAQCESKTAAVVLDILANSGTINVDEYKAEQKINSLNYQERALLTNIESLRYEYSSALYEEKKKLRERESENNRIRRDLEEQKKQLDKLREDLETCETAEGRDRMRMANWFVQNTKASTVYSETANLLALGGILSGTYNPIKEGLEINPKLLEKAKKGKG